MKYIVEVNAKYLVSVEAASCLDAEHQLLDYSGVWGALAYDQKMTKTDTFLGAVQGCEMVSMKEFRQIVSDTMDAKLEAARACGCRLVIIGRPLTEEGISVEACREILRNL